MFITNASFRWIHVFIAASEQCFCLKDRFYWGVSDIERWILIILYVFIWVVYWNSVCRRMDYIMKVDLACAGFLVLCHWVIQLRTNTELILFIWINVNAECLLNSLVLDQWFIWLHRGILIIYIIIVINRIIIRRFNNGGWWQRQQWFGLWLFFRWFF